ncbi:striated muscle-specific serine/threonine-protein kinase-like [Sinocyclocheilus anshuiensis]|nr:PREDICTED: striated muscle-specific serine/threonine-protein kinase-like [Sinocyclocheilus anshuiensis]
MRKAEVQMTLKKGANEEAGGMAPPSPRIPSKRAKVSSDQVVPDPAASVYPTPTPPVFIRKMRNAAVGTGCDIRLKVAVAGDPQPTLYWYHNDDLLNMDNQEYGGLWIRDCKPSDAGLYTCIATNNLGEARSSAVLAVLDLGEDSETTEDEAAEPQIPLEAKEGARGFQDEAQRVPAGERMMDVAPDASDRWAAGETTVLEKEALALGSRAPGPQSARSPSEEVLRESPPQVLPPPSPKIGRSTASPLLSCSGSAPATPLAPRKKVVVPTEYQDTVPGEFEEKIKQPKSSGMSQSSAQDSRPQTPVSEYSRKELTPRPSPKLTRASSKIFEKVRVFEERRRSIDNPEGSISGRSWAGFNRASSIDSDEGGSRLGISRESSKEDLREALKADAAQRRTVFKQRAASLEDRPRYTQKVQDIENKFTEELQRIKKLVGKPHMKKSFSTEQLSTFRRSRQPVSKLEPIPPQVLQKLQDRERAQREQEMRERGQPKERSPPKSPSRRRKDQLAQQSLEKVESDRSVPTTKLVSTFGQEPSPPEAMSLSDLPGQRSPRLWGPSPSRDSPRRSPTVEITAMAEERSRGRSESPSRNVLEMTLRKVEPRPASPLVKRVVRVQELPQADDESMHRKTPIEVTLRKLERRPESPLVQGETVAIQECPVQAPPKPPRVSSSSSSEEKMELDVTPLPTAPKLTIPKIIVEEEPMETDTPAEKTEKSKKSGTAKEEKPQRSRGRGRRQRPMSPEFESSDDSYVSAGEDPLEAPVFEFPLQDTVAFTGTEVLLKCIISGTPRPEVTWKRVNTEIKNSPTHVVKVEGERHSLLLKWTKPINAGTYTVTATNEVGEVSSSATLFIKSEPSQDQRGPITSDEEYLSPLEEGMDFSSYRGPEPRKIVDTRFKEPPSFQVVIGDQTVIEGQEVKMSVRVSGQPKPMLYWLRDRVTIKTDARHIVHETEEGNFEIIIKSAQKSDSGVYTCKIINEYGTKQCEGKLEVKARPIEPGLAIIRPVRDMMVKAGETALFECHVIGPQDTDVDWLSDGKLIQPALLNCKMHFDGKRCRLLLNSVHEDDSGTYTCKLSTAKEELTSSAKLKVVASIEPLFTRKLDVLEVIEGRNARFDCKVSGTPPPQVIWSHFDHPLEESEDIRIVKEGGRHSLIISHVNNEDEGLYTVVARNSHGEDECAAELYVQEPRPAISSQMSLMYAVQQQALGSIQWTIIASCLKQTTYTITNLSKGVRYAFRVLSITSKAFSKPSPATEPVQLLDRGPYLQEAPVIIDKPDIVYMVEKQPLSITVTLNHVNASYIKYYIYTVQNILPDPPDGAPVIESITGKTITLSWKKPRRLDPSIDPSSLMYAVQQQALGSIQWTIIASCLKQTTYTITNLSKGVRYAFRVLSITSKAFSKPSPATEPVQLLDRGPYLQEAPVIIDKPDIVYMVEKQPLSITATLNHVNASVTWKRGGVTLSNRLGLFELSMPDDDQHTLNLCKVKSSDVGQLTCIASNKYGSDSCTLTLEMAVAPTFETIMEDLDVNVGETPRFAVVVEGKPVPDILWYKGDTLLSESSHFTFVYDDNECSLVVLNTQADDSGVYTCTAKNLAGSVSCKAELTVHIVKEYKDDPMVDEASILRKMRRLTDYYDVHKEIGRGAFSYVKRVIQKAGKIEYAAKFISARAKRKASALRELNILSHLDHERILYFHDAFEKKNAVIIITELCHEELLERLTKKSIVMESEIRSSVRQLLEGISYLHQHDILHLDIKPDNILMADPSSDQIRICDFGNAVKCTPDEAQYCKYGTPEFVAPEIVNQTPVSKATDIWPVGVLTYLCLTGVSPFAGENDRSSVLNIRNYNVAFEESMFTDLCHEAKGFVIKLLVADRLRPDANECLRHPWFKTLNKGKSISTDSLKKFLSRRKWQRSLISYKSKMVMRSIAELLDDFSSHISIAVPRHLKQGSPPPSSSSDSDEDIDELPFIPMPINMEFSGSRMSLTEIVGDDEMTGRPNGNAAKPASSHQMSEPMEVEMSEREGGDATARGRARKRSTQEDEKGSSDEEPAELAKIAEQAKRPMRRGSSMESDEPEGVRHRGELRRGSSADSALQLHIKTEEGTEENSTDGSRILQKSVSMELPRRSPSPGAAKLSQEDYALKLELMRQRLLRSGSVDNKMSGLRGPLLETLGMGDEKRYVRGSRLGNPPLVRAASSESPKDDIPKTKILRKSASFSQGDSEPMPLHRRMGAPLEIPLAQIEERRLQEAVSMSALTEPVKDSRPVTLKIQTPDPERHEEEKIEEKESAVYKDNKSKEVIVVSKTNAEISRSVDQKSWETDAQENVQAKLEELSEESEKVDEIKLKTPIAEETIEEEEEREDKEPEKEVEPLAPEIEVKEVEDEVKASPKSPEITISTSSIIVTPTAAPALSPQSVVSTYVTSSLPARTVLPDGRVSAYASIMQTIMVPSVQTSSQPDPVPVPTPTTTSTPPSVPVYAPISRHISEPTLLSTSSSKPDLHQTTEHPAVFSRVASTEHPPKEPSPPKTPTRASPKREPSPGCNIRDLASEEVFEARFKKRESSLTRSLKRFSFQKTEEKPSTVAPETAEEMYRPGPIGAPLQFVPRRLEEKSKSVQDLREAEKDPGFMRRLSMRLKRTPSVERQEVKLKEEEASAPRRRLSWALGRRGSQEKKEIEMVRLDGGPEPPPEPESKAPSESPILAMRKKIGSTMASLSTRIRSHSEERKADNESKMEKRTPIFTKMRRSTSEGSSLKRMGVPQNQLAAQSGKGTSSESLDSMSSIQSESAVKSAEIERRSRWDRWGLTMGKRDKTVSQPDIPASIARENGSLRSRQYTRLTSDFPPVFHIKLRDHVLLEGDPVTLSCLPAGSPHPRISWMKDKKPLEIDPRMNMISCPDGRQLLMIMKTTKKDAGLYECVASNALASVTSSCVVSLARLPNSPGTPEVPQKYKNTALVVWRPSDTTAPCTYSLERKTEGETNWLIVATGVADCYYNVTDLPTCAAYRFRVACVNKAGQGPYSNLSEKVVLDSTVISTAPQKSSGTVVVKTLSSAPAAAPTVVTSTMTLPAMKPAAIKQAAAPPVTSVPSTVQPVKPVSPPAAPASATTPSPATLPPTHRTVPDIRTPSSSAPTSAKAKTTVNITMAKPSPGSPAAQPPPAKPSPPVVLPKPQTPVNAVFPPPQTPPVSPPPLVSPPPAIGKPISSVPMYVPATTTAHVTPVTPNTPSPALSPPVVLVTSLSPVGEGTGTPNRTTPSGRATPSGRITPTGRRTPIGKPGDSTLRQGVPQKPYTFMDEKARGRFGVIRECRENATGNLYMAKIVPYEPESKQAVLQEYDILKSLHHEKVMALHEAYVTPRYLVLISECCSGKELLYSLIDRFRYSEDDVVAYVVQILQGLDYLHSRRILHLDIKPDNIIVTYMNVVKIIDFGSAHTFNPLFLKQFSPPIGTLDYMSPEMLKGDVVGPPADIWSVGILTYIMLSGRLPFTENDPAETEARIQAAKFELSKLYQNVSQSASLFLKKILCSYPWARPTIKDCFNNSWLQDAYLMRLRRQTLTFTTTRLKEFLEQQQQVRAEVVTKHKVLLRSYQSTPQTPTTPSTPGTPAAPISQ